MNRFINESVYNTAMNQNEQTTLAGHDLNLYKLIRKYDKEYLEIINARNKAEENQDGRGQIWHEARLVQLEAVIKDLIKLYMQDSGDMEMLEKI